MREWNPTLPSEFPLWELESRWTFESLGNNYKGQNSLDLSILYTIENPLECKFLKWVCMTHLSTWNRSYGQKKGRESNYQFDSLLLKVKNRPDLLAFKWRATYLWKAFDKGYNFTLDLTSIEGLPKTLWASKVMGVPISGNLGQNDIWVLAPWPGTENTIRRKVVVSPKFGPWWVLWVRVCPWLVHAPKMLQLWTKQLVV